MSDFDLSLNPENPLIKHAFRGSSFAVVRLEELNEISNLKADAVACYRPANSQELFAVERIALSQQAIFRGYRLESGLLTVALDHALDPTCHTFRPMSADLIGDGDIEITRAQNRNYAAGEGVRQMSAESDVWALLIRYQVNADRQYRRAIEDYDRVKRLRPEMPNQPVDSQPKNNDGIASFSELGRSYLEHQQPVTSAPPGSGNSRNPSPAPVAPSPVAFTKPSSDFTPTAYVRRAPAGSETSRLKIVPIASFFPGYSGAPAIAPAPQTQQRSRNSGGKSTGQRPPRSRAAVVHGSKVARGSRVAPSHCRSASKSPISNPAQPAR